MAHWNNNFWIVQHPASFFHISERCPRRKSFTAGELFEEFKPFEIKQKRDAPFNFYSVTTKLSIKWASNGGKVRKVTNFETPEIRWVGQTPPIAPISPALMTTKSWSDFLFKQIPDALRFLLIQLPMLIERCIFTVSAWCLNNCK